MRSKGFLVIAAVAAVALGTARPALADNNADGSTGEVQVGTVGVDPSAGASEAGVSVSGSVPTTVGSGGDNTACGGECRLSD